MLIDCGLVIVQGKFKEWSTKNLYFEEFKKIASLIKTEPDFCNLSNCDVIGPIRAIG